MQQILVPTISIINFMNHYTKQTFQLNTLITLLIVLAIKVHLAGGQLQYLKIHSFAIQPEVYQSPWHLHSSQQITITPHNKNSYFENPHQPPY